ncbi:MarR family transcriptional regulator [Candidatus Woesearchaeota archaeon]|nr:MAG: MarR family transcriptional regulator [Candidatus Woesearchaeota archaeon]
MIYFACKSINKEDLIRCSFALNKTEYKLLMFLLDYDEFITAAKLAKKMGLERTTVQKAVKLLVEKGLVSRKQENLEKGSYIFLYRIKDVKEIKERLRKIVRKWHEKVEDFIDGL